jgi:hypothetical protein
MSILSTRHLRNTELSLPESSKRRSVQCLFRHTQKSVRRVVADVRGERENLDMNARGLRTKFHIRESDGGPALRHVREPQPIRSYADLQKKLHDDLLAQHPEWIDPDGNCPTCDDYDRRFAELISIFQGASQRSPAA